MLDAGDLMLDWALFSIPELASGILASTRRKV
jgi:hypothetical protein